LFANENGYHKQLFSGSWCVLGTSTTLIVIYKHPLLDPF